MPSVTSVSRLTWWKIGLAILSGLLLYLCFPPADLGPLVWLALIPLFFALTQVRPSGGLLLGFVFGFVFLGLYGAFMLLYGRFEWFAIICFQALFFALFGLVAALCNRSTHPAVRALSVAAAWTLAEMFRGGIGGFGFTVGDLGYTQHEQVPLLQVTSMVGHYGLGFFIAAINSAVAQAGLAITPGILVRPSIHPRRFARLAAKTALAGYVIILLLYVWGAIVIRRPEESSAEKIEAAVVQASLGDSENATIRDARDALDAYLALSRTIPRAVDVIIWPEVAIPAALNIDEDFRRPIADLAVEKSAWIVAGGYEVGPDRREYNTLFSFSPEGEQTEFYRKVILVPFGEMVPMRERFPWLARFALRNVDFSPGDRHKVFHLGEWKAGPLICFEALFPHAVRTNALLGADFMVFATSDAWAAGTFEIAQHSATAPIRAAESRRYVLRAGTWGRSQIIDPNGRVLDDVPVAEAGAAWATIRPRQKLSPYHRWGDVPIQIVCAILLLAGLLGLPRMTPVGRMRVAEEPQAEETAPEPENEKQEEA